MMAPNEQLKKVHPELANEDWWFLVEKPGVKVSELIGASDDDDEDM
jgi:hypothetical protein